jgi:hypothetical protein
MFDTFALVFFIILAIGGLAALVDLLVNGHHSE